MTSPILTNQHRQMEVLENLLLCIFFYSCIIYQYLHVYMSISQILHATHDTEKGKPMMLIWKWLKSSRLEPNACRRIHCCWLMRKLRVFSFISWTSDFAMMALSLTICPSTLTRNGDPMNIKSNYNISSNWRLIYWIYRFINLKGDGREKQKLLKFHPPPFFFYIHFMNFVVKFQTSTKARNITAICTGRAINIFFYKIHFY